MARHSRTLDTALRQAVAPALAAHGFRFDGSRTFRRLSDEGRVAEIVNFQLGQRSLAGRFTVNLGVFVLGDAAGVGAGQANEYHCAPARRARLGLIEPPRFPRLAGLPYLGALFAPKDRWWPIAAEPARAPAAVAEALERILGHGLAWFRSVHPAAAARRSACAQAPA